MVAFLAIAWMLRTPRARLVLDHPNPRSLHSTPVPRTGGVGVVLGILAGAAWLFPAAASAVAIAVLLAAVSFLDDRFELPIVIRLAAHLLAAAAFVAVEMPGLPIAGVIAAVFAIVWMTNLYNFMDGSDGLAGGMALVGFGAYALAAWPQEQSFALLSACIAAASAAFLLFNFPPAKIFLGDAGSIPLGFLSAAIGFAGWREGYWPLWFPLVIFSPFIIDASATLAKRLACGERVWQAHHSHYYQRLVRMGWGHRRTAIVEYLVMLAAAASALWALGRSDRVQLIVVLAWAAFYLAAFARIDYRWSRQ
jgi:UDP-GlcNAc:undecaprenyl-phosphate GlcNAc-1-phosphate transferase